MRWRTSLGAPIVASPVIAADGTLFVGDVHGVLHAIGNNGVPEWQVPLGGQIQYSAAIAGGAVCAGTFLDANMGSNGAFYCFDAAGHELWDSAQDVLLGDPTVAVDQTLYVPGGFALYDIRLDGTIRWKSSLAPPWSPAVVPTDGTIVAQSFSNSTIVAFGIAPDGRTRWTLPLDEAVGAIAVGANGVSYASGESGSLHAIGANGSIIWEQRIGGSVYSTPAIGSDGTIYVAGPRADNGSDNTLYAVSPSDGRVRWTASLGGFVKPTSGLFGSPILDADDIVYVGGQDANVYAVAPDGSIKWTSPTGGPVFAAGALGADGTLYIASYDGSLYAIGP